jgi:RimJ/RimL family protein N-acetyltransferase
MTFLITGQDDKIKAWVRSRLPDDVGEWGPSVAIGMASPCRRKFWGGIVFHNYSPAHGTMYFTLASAYPRWATPGTFRALLSYAFDQAGVRKLIAVIASDNERSLKLATRLNVGNGVRFTKEATLRHQFARGRHGIVFSLMDHEFHRACAPALKEAA